MELLSNIELQTELQQLISAEQAWHYWIIPCSITSSQIEFYTNKDYNKEFVDELEVIFGKKIAFKKISTEVMQKTLSKYYRKPNIPNPELNHKNIHSGDFLTNLISEANNNGSSDIHIEAYEDKCRVRLRIDGKLIERYVIEHDKYPALINKVKIKAGLDIAEKRLPQDGRILFNSNNLNFDIRVSVLPTLHGEKIVMRLLSKDATSIDIKQLGLTEEQLSTYLESIRKPHGIILVSGPTGSGKTTTLYATLKILNKEESNILTIEDPIEYTLKGINQVQLKEDIGLTFASALRTFLRQDPDIIMLGEIRDSETAQMAIRASLTGHLVLSTIHTNSAWGIISRLVDMGIPSYLLANTLNLLIAQRLVRLLCPRCKEEVEVSETLNNSFISPTFKVEKHHIAVGCEHCFYTGYKGRKAVYEIIAIDKAFIEAIKRKDTDVDNLFEQKKIKTLADSAFELFAKGETTFDEIYSILKTNACE